MGQKIKLIAFGLIPPVAIVLLWQLASSFGWYPKWLFPSPLETATSFWSLLKDGTLIQLVSLSARNALPAFLIGLIAATTFGTLIGVNSTMKRVLFPSIAAVYPIPSLAWLPLIILFFGFTRMTIWGVIFISTFMRVIYVVIGGVRAVDQRWVLAAKNLGFNKFEIVYKVILPGALPHLVSAVRMGFGSSWRSLIGAEMLVSTLGGLGGSLSGTRNGRWTLQKCFPL